MRIHTLVMALALGAIVQAEQSPGVREVTANERVLTPLTTRIRYTSVIILPDGEDITDVICGDRDNWVINSDRNHAFVKPAKEGATTNLNLLTTTGAIYSFTLREDAKAQTDLKLYVVADPDAKAKPQKYVPATTLTELADQLSSMRADIRAANDRSAQTVEVVRAEARTSATEYPGTLKFPYSWDHKKDVFGISAVWNDGTRTFVRSDKPQEGAAIYEVTSSGPALLTFELSDGLYTIDKVLKKGALVLGKDRLEFSSGK